MIHINFNHLNAEMQEKLLQMAREHVEETIGNALKDYSHKHGIEYEKLVDEESIKKLYTYDYVFNI